MFRLTDDDGLAELFLEPALPTKASIVRHLRSRAVLLPPSITADFLAEQILSAFHAAKPSPNVLDRGSVRILFLAANPMTTSPLDLEEELRSLELELRGTKFRDSIKLVARHAVRPDDLVRYVRDENPNIIHFSGHGSASGIILRNDSGGDHPVEGPWLKTFLRGRGVDLVVLNACYSKNQADLIRSAVKAVVGTTDAVEDEAARRFTAAFYRSLGNGLSVREAFRDGTDAVVLQGLRDVFHSDGDLDLVLVADSQ
jgi:CHAT domain